ncbi:MAG: hypothetical protein Q8O84_01120 [Nanoarchaeota archaeon]|nr:hypothetical protein [Nanoarchaeota archaeon]
MKTNERDVEEWQPITHVFAYKTGTFDNPLSEREYTPTPKVPGFFRGLYEFFILCKY